MSDGMDRDTVCFIASAVAWGHNGVHGITREDGRKSPMRLRWATPGGDTQNRGIAGPPTPPQTLILRAARSAASRRMAPGDVGARGHGSRRAGQAARAPHHEGLRDRMTPWGLAVVTHGSQKYQQNKRCTANAPAKGPESGIIGRAVGRVRCFSSATSKVRGVPTQVPKDRACGGVRGRIDKAVKVSEGSRPTESDDP